MQVLFYVSWNGCEQTRITIQISTHAFFHRKLHLSGDFQIFEFCIYLHLYALLFSSLSSLLMFFLADTRDMMLSHRFHFFQKYRVLQGCIHCSFIWKFVFLPLKAWGKSFYNKVLGMQQCVVQWKFLCINLKVLVSFPFVVLVGSFHATGCLNSLMNLLVNKSNLWGELSMLRKLWLRKTISFYHLFGGYWGSSYFEILKHFKSSRKILHRFCFWRNVIPHVGLPIKRCFFQWRALLYSLCSWII